MTAPHDAQGACEDCGRPIREHTLIEYVFCGKEPTAEQRRAVEIAGMKLAMIDEGELLLDLIEMQRSDDD